MGLALCTYFHILLTNIYAYPEIGFRFVYLFPYTASYAATQGELKKQPHKRGATGEGEALCTA